MMKKKLKVIDDVADILYKKFKSLQVATDRAKAELMEHMASLPKGHTSSFCSFVKEGTTIDRSQVALYGEKYNVIPPYTETIHWTKYVKLVKDCMEPFEQLELYKAKKAYLRGMK